MKFGELTHMVVHLQTTVVEKYVMLAYYLQRVGMERLKEMIALRP